eukprot:9622399-Lingulodinium_polyedra.AAC.1
MRARGGLGPAAAQRPQGRPGWRRRALARRPSWNSTCLRAGSAICCPCCGWHLLAGLCELGSPVARASCSAAAA